MNQENNNNSRSTCGYT